MVHITNIETSITRILLFATAGLMLTSAMALAQAPAQSGPNNSAINTTGQNNSSAPVAGSNSFTEGQAKSRIEDAGYSNISELKKDDNGVWRGKAMKGGTAKNVSVDFQGNVNPID